jgi:hypothetical protein
MQKPTKKEKKLLSFRHYVAYRESHSDPDSGFTGGDSAVGGDIAPISAALAKALSTHKSKTIELLRKLNDEKINAILDKMNADDLNKSSFSKSPDGANGDVLAPNTADAASGEMP